MDDWKACAKTKHRWSPVNEAETVQRCDVCGAAGFRRVLKRPFRDGEYMLGKVIPYTCPVCGKATTVREQRCPNCTGVALPTHLSAVRRNTSFNENQRSVLERLLKGPVDKLTRGESSSMHYLKKRGFVKREVVTIWSITDNGRIAYSRACDEE